MEECRGCLPGHWLGGVFLLLAPCEHKEAFSPPSLARSLQRIGTVPWPLCLFTRGDGAVRGILCFSLPCSREINPFPTPVLLSAARSNSAVNDTSSELPSVMALFSLLLV